jgi:integrase
MWSPALNAVRVTICNHRIYGNRRECKIYFVARLDPGDYGTHSMRRTKATLIYKRTKNLRAIQLLLGHTKLESTVRYLGIEVDDALQMSEQTEV